MIIKPIAASLSTMWAIRNYPDLNDFFKVAGELGFEKIELNHQVDTAMLANINLDHHQFSSVHEPCPADISTKELVDRDWLISSADKESRKKGVECVKRSINLAHNLNSPVVVVHCGNVSGDQQLERELRSLYNRAETRLEDYANLKLANIRARSDAVKPRLKAVKESLLDLINYATKFNIKLGMENRYHYMDIPVIDEMDELLSLADSSQLGFIYDVGHAQALDRLGFFPHEEWLLRYSKRMIGAHLHDVRGLSDHMAPGLGDIDFNKICPYLQKSAFRTFELQPGNTLAQVSHGIDVLIESGCILYI